MSIAAHLVILRFFLTRTGHFLVVLAFSIRALTRLRERREFLEPTGRRWVIYLAGNNVARNDVAEDVLVCGEELEENERRNHGARGGTYIHVGRLSERDCHTTASHVIKHKQLPRHSTQTYILYLALSSLDKRHNMSSRWVPLESNPDASFLL